VSTVNKANALEPRGRKNPNSSHKVLAAVFPNPLYSFGFLVVL
jgi:hypothetical protein